MCRSEGGSLLRRLAKTGIARGLSWTGADAWFGALSGSRRRPLVVGYHRVVEDPAETGGRCLPGMTVSTAMLEAHVDWIARHYRLVSLDTLGKQLASGEPAGKALAAVTFDDGYAEVYERAFPLLRRKGIPAAVFVVTSLVDTSRLLLHDRLYLLLRALRERGESWRGDLALVLLRLGITLGAGATLPDDAHAALVLLLGGLRGSDASRLADALEAETPVDPAIRASLRCVTWPMLREMQAAGFTIGSHGRTHAQLPNESVGHALVEAAASRGELERRLGVPVRHFAYPNGSFDATSVEAVGAAGYRFAYTVCPHRHTEHPLLTIPRRMLWEQSCVDGRGVFSDAMMSCQSNGVFDVVAPCRLPHAWAPRRTA